MRPTHMASFNLNYLLKTLFPHRVTLESGLQYMYFKGTQFSPQQLANPLMFILMISTGPEWSQVRCQILVIKCVTGIYDNFVNALKILKYAYDPVRDAKDHGG